MRVVISILLCFTFFVQSFATKSTNFNGNKCQVTTIKKKVKASHSCCHKMDKQESTEKNNLKSNCCKGFDICTCSLQLTLPPISFTIDIPKPEFTKPSFGYLESNSSYTFSFFQPPRFAS